MKKIKLVEPKEDDNAISYWMQKTSEERLDALELLREQFYIIQGYQSVPRIIRVLKLVDR
jgi:hypothetical protein